MLDLGCVLRLKKDIVLRELADKHWALNVKDGTQYRLNETAYFMLDRLRAEKSVGQLLDEVLNEYNVARTRLEKDCVTVFSQAISNGLVEEVKV